MYANINTFRAIETMQSGTILDCQVKEFYNSLNNEIEGNCILVCARNTYTEIAVELASRMPDVVGIVIPTYTDLAELGHRHIKLDYDTPEYLLTEALHKYSGVADTVVIVGDMNDYMGVKQIVWSTLPMDMECVFLALTEITSPTVSFTFDSKEHVVPIVAPTVGHSITLTHESVALTPSVLPECRRIPMPQRKYIDVPVLTTNKFGPLWRGFTYREYCNLSGNYVNQLISNMQPSPLWGTVLIISNSEVIHAGYSLSHKLCCDYGVEHVLVQRLPEDSSIIYSYNLGKFDSVIVLSDSSFYRNGTHHNLIAALQHAGNQDIYIFI